MTNPYGPWATAIDPGRNPQLSAFWRQRLTMLVLASETSPVLSRRNLLGLVAAAVLVGALPTFHVAWAVTDQEKRLRGQGNDDHPVQASEKNAPAAESQQTSNANPSKVPFEAQPPGGVTVELLSVGENGAGWWRPNGMPWDANSRQPFGWGTRWTAKTGEIHRMFFLRIKAPLGRDVSLFARSQNDQMIIIREPLLAVSGMPGKSAHMDQSQQHNERTKEELIEGKLHGSFPVGAAAANVLIGLPSEWKTVAERDATKADFGEVAADVIFAPNPTLPHGIVEMNSDTTLITIAYHGNSDQEMRILAVDTNGDRQLARMIVTSPGLNKATWVFSMPDTRIKKFLLQRTPCTWVEFRNVAIQSGQKTDVQIEITNSGAVEDAK